ncbi:uncharacterized protein PRCAT00004169001 [Priceomyces carsonii]|uniref:uncharacterized protein n=1 Tax=Priceomyces carsonii TaxID=28549 RepID=UPI002EDA1D89|nr:unnamed protein product [Priceomyces carsonii]
MERPISKYYSTVISQSQKSINSIHSLIGISSFQYQLICYYQQLCESDFVPHLNPKMNAWFFDSQRLGFHSELVRDCIYAISTMHLENLDFYDQFKGKSATLAPAASKFLTIHHRVFEPDQIRGFHQSKKLHTLTVQYFLDCVKKTIHNVNNIKNGDVPSSGFQAIEMYISSLIIFNLLLHHQTMFLSLVSNDPSQSNLLSVCMGMKHMLSLTILKFQQTSFGILFEEDMNSTSNVSNLCNRITLTDHLTAYRLKLEEEGEISPHDSFIYADATTKLNNLLYNLIVLESSSLIWGWIFQIHDEFYILAKEKKEYFACKILFYYCSLRIIVTGKTSYQGNTWTDYCYWFKKYNLSYYGRWRDSEDESLFELVFQYKYEIKDLSTFLAANELNFEELTLA